MITYTQQGIIKYDIKHVIFLFRVHIMKKITVSNVVSLFYFLDAGRPVTGIFTFYILYIFCAFMSRLFMSSIYVFHLWALHIYVYLLLAHINIYVCPCILFMFLCVCAFKCKYIRGRKSPYCKHIGGKRYLGSP